MSDEPRWTISLHNSDGKVSREVEVKPGENAYFTPADMIPSTIVGMTLYDESGVVAEFVANEAGELVPAEPGEGIFGAALSSEGFSPPLPIGTLFGIDLVSCLTCGATIPLSGLVEGQTHPLDAHRAWHQTHESRPQSED